MVAAEIQLSGSLLATISIRQWVAYSVVADSEVSGVA